MFRNLVGRRFLSISLACAELTLGLTAGLALQLGAAGEAWAQPAPAKSSASPAPKNASPAPSATQKSAPNAPPSSPSPPAAAANPVPSETPAENPEPVKPESATELPAPPAAPEPTAPPPELVKQWRSVYEHGKSAMAGGSFPIASRMLNDVATRAPDPVLQAQARELADLAAYWTRNRLVLKPFGSANQPNATPPEVLKDERSIDELAILYSNTLIWGTGFGMVIGFGSNNSSAATFMLPAIGMSALGAGALTYAELRHGPIPYGVPQSITSGLYMGLEVGIYTVGILEGLRAVQDEDKVFPGLLWGSATAGGLIGGLVGGTVPITPGRASFTSSGAIWGGLVTSLVTIGFTGGDFETAPFVTGLIGATAGGVTTGLLGGYISPSIARVRFLDVGAFAGGLVFGGLYASLADRLDEQAFSFMASAGVVVGLATTAVITRDMDRDEPRRGVVRKSASWRATPFMTPQPGGGTLGLMGTF